MRDWREPQSVEVPREFREAVGGHPLVAMTLVRRGITGVEEARAFLDPDEYRPTPAAELPDMIVVAERLERAVDRDETIWVWGDFDVDGQTATTILVSTLRNLGASVRFHIPNREREGHGVNLRVLREIVEEGAEVVLTCDTGVTAHDAVAHAQGRGVDMLITDHHDLPRRLPAAYAVVDPKMVPQGHPLRELPGVGVAYKLAELLCERAGTADEVSRYHDLAALGIVADVATQRGDVRYLLQRGLQALRHTERLGLQALMDIAELDPEWLTEEHIGYELAPRLNALGRLADATPSVEFLTTDDVARVRILAHELDGLNARRKLMCDQVVRAAEAQIERDRSLLERGALVLSHPSWPAGVIGIVAGRLAEKYRRPTILVATPPGKLARGSARSIEGCDISAAIAEHGDMLESFGGHPMAAGLSIDPARIPELRRAVSRTVCEICDQALAEEPVLEIDGYVPLSDLSIEFVREMERMAPFGPGNLSLTFAARGLSLTSHRKIGRTDEHLELVVEDEGGATQRVLWWRGETAALPGRHFDLAYTVRTTDYRGRRNVQVEWVDARPIAEPKALAHPRSPTIEVIDYRTASDRQERLRRLGSEGEVVVWSEGKTEVRGRSRHVLESSDTLAIWTAPPGARELRDALERVSPTIVYLFGVDPGFDEPKSFLTRLAGLAKQAVVAQGGIVKLSTLTAATAQREETIQAGLAWLEARGDVTVLEDKGDEMRLGPGEGVTSADFSVAVSRLRSLLSETRAYRAYLARADAEGLIRSIQSD